jgi:DNA-binding NtrC family response regulator
MAQSPMIDPGSLPNFLFSPGMPPFHPEIIATSAAPASYNMVQAVRNLERNLIGEVLSVASSRSQAIKMLGISRRTFYLKLKEYALE